MLGHLARSGDLIRLASACRSVHGYHEACMPLAFFIHVIYLTHHRSSLLPSFFPDLGANMCLFCPHGLFQTRHLAQAVHADNICRFVSAWVIFPIACDLEYALHAQQCVALLNTAVMMLQSQKITNVANRRQRGKPCTAMQAGELEPACSRPNGQEP